MSGEVRFEEILRAVQDGSLRLELDAVSIIAPDRPVTAVPFRFSVTVADQRFLCRWRLQPGQEVPDELASLVSSPNRSISSAADAYEIIGRTEKGIAVRLTGVRPYPSTTHYGSGATHYESNFDQLHFPAEGSDALNTEQHLARLNAVGGVPDSAVVPDRKGEPEEDLLAIIPAVELQILQPGTETRVLHPLFGETFHLQSNCFLGEVLGGKFCLEAKKGELFVHFRRPVAAAVNVPSAHTVFEGVLAALGYTHGCHPWPIFQEHRIDLRVVERWIRPYANRSTRVQLPIEAGRLATADGERLFQCAAKFFAGGGDEVATFRRALWLMREATRHGMAFEIRLITLCSIFEGLMHMLAKTVLTADEEKLVRSQRWSRLIIQLGLPWDNVFEKAFESWQFYRHPLAHGFKRPSGETNATVFHAYSRLSAAIHILMAKRMGFVGHLDISPMESAATVELK